ncbi:hypothetical protein [Streptomyces sp. NPDC058305]|uniref:hypothetical protein n=1 Tax=Streptomyces sp. NPDC058305 TaxID=3346438 RepID=UPI0036EAC2A6
MRSHDLVAALAVPTAPQVREALARLSLPSLESLTIEALNATEGKLRDLVVDRVVAFVAQEGADGPAPVAAYFRATERRAMEGMTWSPSVAALAATEEVPDLRYTRTQAIVVPVGEAELAENVFSDHELASALNRLAAIDPPDHGDVLRVHLPTRQISRVRT